MKKHLRLLSLLGAAFLFSCATQVDKPEPVVAEKPPVAVEEIGEETESAIKALISDFNQSQDQEILQTELLRLAEDYQQKSQCFAAEQVLNTMLALPMNLQTAFKVNIIRSECAVLEYLSAGPAINSGALNERQETQQVIIKEKLDEWLSQTPSAVSQGWQERASLLQAFKRTLDSNFAEALSILMANPDADSPFSSFQSDWRFTWFANMSNQQRMSFIASYPELFGFNTLLSIIEDEQLSEAQRSSQVRAVVEQLVRGDSGFKPPEQVSAYLQISAKNIESIAVLLPLSGRLESQGDAIKQGIIAGYFDNLQARSLNQKAPNIDFIDTGSDRDISDKLKQSNLNQYDLIIGPLLKRHVSQVQSILETQPIDSAAPSNRPVELLFLNQPDELATDNNHSDVLTEDAVDNAFTSNFEANDSTQRALTQAETEIDAKAPMYSNAQYFALSPEDEASQLAVMMHENNISQPILIHDDSVMTQRMADAFIVTWEKLKRGIGAINNDYLAPSTVKYTDNKSMRASIMSSLDVLQSQKRINLLSNLVNEEVFSVTRNRRDVDAFVVFARPNELELINPIIESSMSFFSGKQIPVYASSFSYNHKQNRNSLRDLRNLVFVDMPFLLPDGRQGDLANDVDQIFNQPSSSFLRLFAFGHDAMQLSRNIRTLKSFEQVQSQGLSGKLSIDKSGKVQRELEQMAIQAGN